jgi:hypothetical protein
MGSSIIVGAINRRRHSDLNARWQLSGIFPMNGRRGGWLWSASGGIARPVAFSTTKGAAMYRTVLILLIAVFSQIGCVAVSKNLISPSDGRQARCGAWGFGLIGTPIAYGTYKDCVNKTEALGFVDLEDFQKSEGAKVVAIPGATAVTAGKPVWDTGTEWTYQFSGARRDTVRQHVLGKDLVAGHTAYMVEANQANPLTLVLDEDFNAIQVRSKGTVMESYTPPLEHYRWPLSVGKTWKTTGVMETTKGKIDISQTAEVKSHGMVRVPAGEFEAFYLVSTTDTGVRAMELWYAPKLKHYVKVVNYTDQGWVIAELTSSSLKDDFDRVQGT